MRGGYWARTQELYVAMNNKDHSSRTLARQVGVHDSMIRYLVGGKRSCSHRVASSIAEALGSEVDNLFFTRGVHS